MRIEKPSETTPSLRFAELMNWKLREELRLDSPGHLFRVDVPFATVRGTAINRVVQIIPISTINKSIADTENERQLERQFSGKTNF